MHQNKEIGGENLTPFGAINRLNGRLTPGRFLLALLMVSEVAKANPDIIGAVD